MLVVGKRRGHEPLGGLVFPEHREQVLLFEPGEQIQLRLEIREQPLACLDRTVRGVHELGEELVGLGRTGLKQLSDGRHVVLMKNWSQTQYWVVTSVPEPIFKRRSGRAQQWLSEASGLRDRLNFGERRRRY